MNHETAASLFVLLLAAIGIIVLMSVVPAPASDVCLTKKEARHLWPRRHIYWYSSDRCWSNRRGPPRGLKLEPEPKKEKKIKGDPVFNQIRAEDEPSVDLGSVTWHMRRPFDEAQPIIPPLNLATPDDPDVWPSLSEFEMRFVGVQP